MKGLKTFILNLQFIFKPSYWLMNYPYSKEMDEFISKLLDNHDFTDISNFTAKLGGVVIWTANSPYASMTMYSSKVRPSRLTIQRGEKKLQKDYIQQVIKNANL